MKVSRKLEALVDTSQLSVVLELLSNMCYEKAMHIEDTWQDKYLAKEWAKAGKSLWKLSQKFYYI